ncbi:hypothetical protein EVAR_103230_1 [Eumeta japonica]|uniref:Uncharacterized protein n=1 Tax=Eumeta variegata TaxID=151549 RepID=A0A4C1XA75_EUMVA|nr:hypothetical protein EVAR_103230_1 [Eumeta japonica]
MGIGCGVMGSGSRRILALSENLSRASPGQSYSICRGDKFPYRKIGSSRFNCGNEVHHTLHLIYRKGEMRTREVKYVRRDPLKLINLALTRAKDVGANEVLVIDELVLDEIMKAEKRMKV